MTAVFTKSPKYREPSERGLSPAERNARNYRIMKMVEAGAEGWQLRGRFGLGSYQCRVIARAERAARDKAGLP